MKTCPKCGNVIHNDNARFCKECGTDLYGKNDGGIWLGDPQTDSTPSTPKQTKSDTPIAKIGIIAAAVIALILILFFAFSGNDEESEVTEPETEVATTPQETPTPKRTDNTTRRETSSEQTQSSTTNEVAGHRPVTTQPAELEKTDDSQKKKLSSALAKGDYKQVQILANEGYAPAYVPLAKYYLNNNEYDDADRYAKKAKAAGQSGAQAIITTLENLGYYD